MIIFTIDDSRRVVYIVCVSGHSMGRESNSMFSTPERDNDRSPYHCAEDLQAAWWHWVCSGGCATLHGQYVKTEKAGVIRQGLFGLLSLHV